MNKLLIILFSICFLLSGASLAAASDSEENANQLVKTFDELCKSNRDDLNKIESSNYLKHSMPFSKNLIKSLPSVLIDSSSKGYLFGEPGSMMYSVIFTPHKYCVLIAINVDNSLTENLLTKKYNLGYPESLNKDAVTMNIYKFNRGTSAGYDEITIRKEAKNPKINEIAIIYRLRD